MGPIMQRERLAVVTGGGGFIGQALIRRLLSDGWLVRNLDLVPGTHVAPGLSFYQGTFSNIDLLREAMAGAECLFHLASAYFPREANLHPGEDARSTILGIITIGELAAELGVRRIVFASSGGTVYGRLEKIPVPEDHPTRPLTAYGISKLAAEHYLRFFAGRGVETLSLRIANPYGAGQNINKAQGALTTFCHRAVYGQPIEIWGDGSVERDFIHVEDVARALALAASTQATGTEINIGSGRGTSLNELLRIINEVTGHDMEVSYHEARYFDVPRSVLAIGRARDMLGWRPRKEISEGITEMIGYFEESRLLATSP